MSRKPPRGSWIRDLFLFLVFLAMFFCCYALATVYENWTAKPTPAISTLP